MDKKTRFKIAGIIAKLFDFFKAHGDLPYLDYTEEDNKKALRIVLTGILLAYQEIHPGSEIIDFYLEKDIDTLSTTIYMTVAKDDKNVIFTEVYKGNIVSAFSQIHLEDAANYNSSANIYFIEKL